MKRFYRQHGGVTSCPDNSSSQSSKMSEGAIKAVAQMASCLFIFYLKLLPGIMSCLSDISIKHCGINISPARLRLSAEHVLVDLYVVSFFFF